MYEYRARIVRVIDGDTLEAEIDLGFHVSLHVTLRLAGINAPETRGPERPRGLLATRHLEALLAELTEPGGGVTLRTRKDATEKYGRYLAEIIAGGVNVNERMLSDGHARPFDC